MLQRLNILIVDNDPEVAQALTDQALEEGIAVHCVASGYEAIECMKAGTFDAVVTDYHMSEGDGISLAHYCSNHAVPCMVVTGFKESVIMPYLPPGTPIFDKTNLLKSRSMCQEIRGLLVRDLMSFDQRTERIYVIDDVASETKRIRRLLEGEDRRFVVEGTVSSDEGLKQMTTNEHDAYLLDYRLGVSSGIDLLRQARHQGCRRPILLMTAMGDEKTAFEAMHSGADDFIDKGEMSSGRLKYAINYAIKRRRSDDLLAKQQLRVANAQKLSALGEMAVAVAHEIKNPLAIIMARTGMLIRSLAKPDLDKDKMQKDLVTIEDTCDRIATIIETMQNHYLASGSFEKELTSIASMMSDAYNLCRYKAKFERTEIRLENCEQEHQLDCIPSEFCQMVMNLIVNAIEATEGLSERWVQVDTKVQQGKLTIAVTDSGSGKNREIEDAIRRAGSTSKASAGGMGFGLQFVKMIAEKYGGNLSLDKSTANTCLRIEVPLEQEAAYNPSILIVDDNADILDIVSDRLKNAGLDKLYTAFDGFEADRLIREKSPDVVLSDINIPGQTGQELLTNVRMSLGEKSPRFVFMTGLRPEEIPRMIVKLGVKVLHKPFDMNDLLVELRKRTETSLPAVQP